MANRSEAPTAHPHGSSADPRLRGSWLARGKEGRFSLYLPRDGGVVRWTENAGGGWSGPVPIGGGSGGLLPGLSAGQGADGYVHLVALRSVAGGDPDRVELVHTTQYQTGRPALEWRSITHPNGAAHQWTGTPSVTVDGIGRAYVFCRNGGGGISVRAQKDAGGWHPWWDLLGSKTDPLPVAVTNGSGFVELYSSHAAGLVRYVQRESGAKPLREELLPAPVTMGTMAAVRGPSGHVTAFYLDKEGRVCAWSPERASAPVPLGEAVGEGPLSVVRCSADGLDHTLLAQRDSSGRLQFASYPAEREEGAELRWAPSGPAVQGPPALTVDASGGVVAAALAPGGEPIVAGRAEGAGLLPGAWNRI
ncbi:MULTISPECIES: hypothetical protein [Streptomyces]|uniref:hypothetical protein n=1 Tax=Streptomyces TaxID=1883 RepID=UPI0007895525|nr:MULTISPECIES: hypothetical protein [unclassified Streptomyces]AVH94947.1 hypothetical protein C5L38_07595 [Streptomyces sp. WAC00288]KYG53651.1 hypothetical protein AWI43_03500 [Streptomyces sp. WAC04657]